MEQCDIYTHVHNPARLAALRAVALLDTPVDEAFDRLTSLATHFLKAPVALVSLVDEDRQFFKSCIGLPEPWQSRRETPLSHSFCQHNRIPKQPLLVADARNHPLFKDNPAIQDLNVIAYLGVPLVTSDGYVLGSFCVIDSRPREWTERDIRVVEDLSLAVMTEIQLRTEIKTRLEAEEQLKSQNEKLLKAYQDLEAETGRRTLVLEQLRERDQLLIRQGRLAAMGEMIRNIGHHWRQPLNTLALLAQELPMTYGTDEFSRGYLETAVQRMMRQIAAMSETIEDFAYIFRASDRITEFSVNEAVKKTLTLLEESLEEKGITATLAEKEVVYIRGCPNQYCQVIVNLLLNARDALVDAGTEAPQIAIEIGSDGGRSLVTVTDNAGGVPEEIADRIFDPYFTTKGPNRGSGLGLYIAKMTIEKQLGGSLTVTNLDHGAQFRIVV
jgi:C4-dicarboxylate-specific signal transduction histidine kinase